ncbi:MAG: hypothetical protein ACF8R7_07420 [Phycisphaerales bacterium JB039]
MRFQMRCACGAILLASGWAMAQGGLTFEQPEPQKPVVVELPDPNDPAIAQARIDAQRLRQIEKELRKLRQQYFRGARSTEIREAGIAKLRDEYNDPALFNIMLEVFGREEADVQRAILRMFAADESEVADGAIAWTAVFGESESLRKLAVETLQDRFEVAQTFEPQIPRTVSSVVQAGLAQRDDAEVEWAASVAQSLKLYEAIPWLVQAQAQARSSGRGSGPLANILIGTQQAFVSDLQPIVGDSAVAFDPTLSVVTEGVVLQVFDAVVVTYRMGVYNSLVGMTSDAWGQPTDRLGFDPRKWDRWLREDFRPHLEQKRREAQAEAPGAAQPEAPGAPDPGGN